MPLYDYACSACGRRVEILHGREAPGPTTCEVCGGPMRKLMSAPSVHFKGSGWAKRDRAVATAPASADSGSSSDKAAADGETIAPAASAGDGASKPAASSASPASSAESKAPAKVAAGDAAGAGSRRRHDSPAGSKRSTSTTGSGSD